MDVGIGTTTPLAGLDIATTGTGGSALIIPRDSLVNRPVTAASVNGMIRYNTNTNAFEFFQNGSWASYNTGAGGSVNWPLTASPNTAPPSSPQYTFGGSTDTGLFSPGTTTLGLVTGNSERLRIDAAGNVGIGTTTPGSRLEVSASSAVTNADTNGTRISFTDSGSVNSAGGQAKVGSRITTTGSGNFTSPGAGLAVYGLVSTSTFTGTTNSGGFSNTVGVIGVNGNGVWSGTVGDPSDSGNVTGVSASATGGFATAGNNNHIGVSVQANGLANENIGVSITGINTGTSNYGVKITSPSAGANNYQIYAASSAKSYFGGSVGIGASTPNGALEVSGTGTTSSFIVVPRDTTAGRPVAAASVNGSIRYNTNANAFEGFANGAWGSLANSSTSFPLLASPGTTPPGAPSYSFNGSTNTGLFSPSVGQLALSAQGTTAITIDGSGNVGIGTTAPSSTLQVNGTTTVKGVVETVVAGGTCSTSYNIDPTTGTMFTLTLNGACSIGVTNLAAGQSFTVKLTQSSTTAPTFSATFKWPSGTQPTWSTSATKYDVLACASFDGSTLQCNGMVDVR